MAPSTAAHVLAVRQPATRLFWSENLREKGADSESATLKDIDLCLYFFAHPVH